MNKNNEILSIIGDNIRFYRIQFGLTQEELSFRANVHRTYIGMVERAEKNITIISLNKIAKALNVDLYDLLNKKNL